MHLPKLDVYEKSQGKWYIKSHGAGGKEKLLFDENKSQRRPEEIVRQLFLFELTDNYGYPIEKIKAEESVSFGREKKRAEGLTLKKVSKFTFCYGLDNPNVY
ncbi:MAG: type I restriction enzyme HsdR N-terminal domain-containing protein [Caldisericum sp.]|uniref:type I restriction enzyme HsdR N-terminal domain-containing protein n=1 Tax=Caldisericum sp. TaxID=2499687 RepID=UPI003D135470